jgi:hypothetical protein
VLLCGAQINGQLQMVELQNNQLGWSSANFYLKEYSNTILLVFIFFFSLYKLKMMQRVLLYEAM